MKMPNKSTNPKVVKIKDLFKPEELAPLPDELEGKLLILDPKILAPQYRQRKFLVYRATGGFGCHAACMGTAVYAECLSDGEKTRWERYEFLNEYIGPVPVPE